MRRITDLTVEANKKLGLTYDESETVTVDFTPVIKRGNIFKLFAEDDFFSQVKIGKDGRFIEWPNNIDFCADALWLAGHDKDFFTRKAETAGSN